MEKPISTPKYTKPKPTLYLSNSDLPEIKSWKIGETYPLILNCKLTGQRMCEDSTTDGKKQINADFEILSVKTNKNQRIDEILNDGMDEINEDNEEEEDNE